MSEREFLEPQQEAGHPFASVEAAIRYRHRKLNQWRDPEEMIEPQKKRRKAVA